MTSKARVYEKLLLVVWLCEFDKEYLRGEVVDVGETEGDEGV
jgi:hypothetical protein